MPSIAADPAALRRLLAERFPTAHAWGETPAGRVLATGLDTLDESTGGGLPCGAITELVATAPSCGGQLFLGQLIAAARAQQQRVALVDVTDAFDPGSFGDDALSHVVWVRGTGDLTTALGATDLLARDANLGLVILDVRDVPLAALRRTPAPLWYRLQRAVETADLALVVHTPRALVPSARLRLELECPHGLPALGNDRLHLAQNLTPRLRRQRLGIATGS